MDKLGIEPSLLLAQIINFAIVVAVLTKLLYTPILTMLAKRRKEIEEGVHLTAKAREEEEKLKEKQQKMLVLTRKEAQDILEEARKQAKLEEREILDAAHKEAELILQKGKADVLLARSDMEKKLQAESVELAIAMSKRLLTGVLSAEDKHKLIAKHVKEIGSMNVS